MNAIQEVKDEAIRKVAQTLKSSGLASSETEAVRMAMAMSKTSQRVTANFDQRKSSATMGTHFSNADAPVDHSTDVHVKGGLTFAFSNNGSAPAHAESHTHSFAFSNDAPMSAAPVSHNVQAPFSVQEKPSKIEEKEEFIFGDVQENNTAQEKDVYKVENEFEEVVSQEVISTKPKITAFASSNHLQAPKAFGTGTISRAASQPSQTIVHSDHAQASQAPVHERMQTPAPMQGISSAPMSAQSSAQMAFASILGEAQRTQTHHQEAKPAVHSSPDAPAAQPAMHTVQPVMQPAMAQPAAQPAHAAYSCPRPITHVADPRASMMKEANVDLSKMFNVNK